MEEQLEKLQNIVGEKSEKQSPKKIVVPLLIIIVLGILSGFILAKSQKGVGSEETGVVSQEKIKPGSEFGSTNQTFKDTTLGVLEKGGIDGEGTHKLIREGGISQTVYLTSSVLDLDQFAGKKVQVWGETFQAQKAGWLMDVGRLKILE